MTFGILAYVILAGYRHPFIILKSKQDVGGSNKMNPLVGIHVALGELGAIAFLWVFVELLDPTPARRKRAQIVALVGTALLISSWVVGGFYYVTYYGTNVKPVIKSGPQPWAHNVFMEVKEHVFLLLPFLAVVLNFLLFGVDPTKRRNKSSMLILSLAVFGLGMLMALLGFLISSGYRVGLGGV
ncbi:MAG: hypothetical protein E3J35_07630 [Methanomassiliicoccales archaeon]|nr:MAG: hypothetical protein E3J35_07630 [Methanomassiliicoccales archaeon]